jgi:FtsP/CotA-like multicopper oxidase with cupredoxin domain
MTTMKLYRILPAAVFFVSACGGGDAPDTGSSDAPAAPATAATPAGPMAPTGAMTMPDWFAVDNDARTVTLDITAGAIPDNNYWNFNGYIKGQLAINVPEGYTVTINYVNEDPNMAHSLGISSELSNFTMPPSAEPVFAGAITENPQSMIDATMPGESETITFVADAAGNYTMVCYIAGHTAIGMWLFFNVTDGEAGVQGL